MRVPHSTPPTFLTRPLCTYALGTRRRVERWMAGVFVVYYIATTRNTRTASSKRQHCEATVFSLACVHSDVVRVAHSGTFIQEAFIAGG